MSREQRQGEQVGSRYERRNQRRLDGLAPDTPFTFTNIEPLKSAKRAPHQGQLGVVIGPVIGPILAPCASRGIWVWLTPRVRGKEQPHAEEWSGAVYVLPLTQEAMSA